MRRLTIVLGVAGLILVMASYIITDIGEMGGSPLDRIGGMIIDFDPILKVATMLLAVATVVMVFGSLPQLARPSASPDTDMLMVLTYGSVGVGLVAAAYGVYNISRAVQNIGPVSFPVMAPSVAEAVLMAAIGLIVGAIGAGLRAIIEARKTGS